MKKTHKPRVAAAGKSGLTAREHQLQRFPFDQYSRQKIAFELIDSLRKGNEHFTILDVGGYKGITPAFHDHDKVTVLDVFDVDEPDYIQGDATDMTFDDNAYDFVVSFDVFEHIPRERREAFVKECTRVAKRGVIIAAPVGTSQNAAAEVYLNDVFRTLHGKDHPWLIEHIDYRLPEPGLAGELMRKNHLQTFELSSNYLPFWLLMQGGIFAASKFDKIGHQIDDLYERYNGQMFPDGSAEVSHNYRIVTCGLKTEADARTIEQTKRRTTPSAQQTFDDSLQVTKEVLKVLVKGLDDFHAESESRAAQLAETVGLLNQANNDIVGLKQQVEILKTDLARIHSSRAYQIVRKVGDAKQRITNRAKKRK